MSLGADFVFWAQSTPILQMNTVRLREGKGLAQDLKAVRGRAGLAPCPPSHSYLQYHHRSSKCFLSFPFIPVVLVLSSRAVQHAGSLVPRLEIKPSPSAVKAPSSSHWATRESPHSGSHARRRFKLVTCVDPLYHTFRGEVGLSRAQLGGEGPGLGCGVGGGRPVRQMQRQVPGQDWDLEWLREELGLGRRGGVQMGEAPSGVGVG